MSRYNFYPEFVADQVLTAKQLNDLFNYLDEQEQITRTILLGAGIVCGLDSSFNGKVIKISKGAGITTSGNIISFSGDEFTHFRQYKLPDSLNSLNPYAHLTMYELVKTELFKEGDSELAAETQFLRDYAVVLFLEKKTEDLKNCLADDCEDKGRKVNFNVKPVLIKRNDLSAVEFTGLDLPETQLEIAKSSLPDIFLKRFNVPFKTLKTAGEILSAFQNIVNSGVLKQVAEACNLSFNVFRSVLQREQNPFEKLNNTLLEKLAETTNNQLIYSQYFYDFIHDLILGYNEFKVTGLEILSACLPDDSLFPFHLSLGEATLNSRDGMSGYRNYFIYSPILNNQKEKVDKLNMLFERMVLLVESFRWPHDAKTIKIIPDLGEKARLSQKVIPFYYEPSKLLGKWNFLKSKYKKEKTILSYYSGTYNKNPVLPFVENPLEYDRVQNDFFRIEGHVGMDFKTAFENVLKQRDEYNLPFNIVALKLGDDATDIAIEGSHFDDLESQFEAIRKGLLSFLERQICFLASQKLVVKQEFFLFPTTIFYTQVQYYQPLFLQISQVDKPAEEKKQTETEPRVAQTGKAVYTAVDFSKQENVFSAIEQMQMETIREIAAIPGRVYEVFPGASIDWGRILISKNGNFLKSQSCYKAWKEGDSEMTMGQYYIHSIIKKNPLPKNFETDQFPLKNVYVELIDKIESMARLIQETSLSAINENTFEVAWETLRETARILLQNVEKNMEKLKGASYAPDFTELTQNMYNIMNRGESNSLKVLKEEMAKRTLKIQQEWLFSNFMAKHPGIEHRGGVYKGGTFIMVYHDQNSLAKAVGHLKVDGVIVDFYLPYLCCGSGVSNSQIQVHFGEIPKKEIDKEDEPKPSEPEPKPERDSVFRRPPYDELIKMLPADLEKYPIDILKDLPLRVLEQLSPAKIATFDSYLIQEMSVPTLEKLDVVVLEKLPVNTLEQLTPAKLETFSAATIQKMSPATLETLNAKTLEQLPVKTLEQLTPAKIETFSAARIQKMSPATLETLNAKTLEQLPVKTLEQLTPAKIETFSAATIQKMSPVTLEKLNTKTLEQLPVKTLEQLSPAKIETFSAATIQKMSPATLEKLNTKTLEQLPVKILEQLTPAKIETFSAATIQKMSPATLEKLNTKTLEQLPVKTLEQLSPAKIETLNVKVIEKMSPATLEKLNPKTLEKLDVSILKSLDTRVLKGLNQDVIKRIDIFNPLK